MQRDRSIFAICVISISPSRSKVKRFHAIRELRLNDCADSYRAQQSTIQSRRNESVLLFFIIIFVIMYHLTIVNAIVNFNRWNFHEPKNRPDLTGRPTGSNFARCSISRHLGDWFEIQRVPNLSRSHAFPQNCSCVSSFLYIIPGVFHTSRHPHLYLSRCDMGRNPQI